MPKADILFLHKKGDCLTSAGNIAMVIIKHNKVFTRSALKIHWNLDSPAQTFFSPLHLLK